MIKMFGNGKKGTRRNTHTDRINMTGQETGKYAQKRSLKWGKPGDEMGEDAISPEDPNYDSADELFEKAFGTERGGHIAFDWAAVADLSEDDSDNMDECEASMKDAWVREVEEELHEVEDDAEEFFAQ